LLACFTVFIIAQKVAGKLLALAGTGQELRNLVKGIFASASLIITYRLFFKWIEKRAITEISTKNIAKNSGLGIVTGATIQWLTMLVIYLNHGFKVVSVNPV
jgi:hypothetical protein